MSLRFYEYTGLYVKNSEKKKNLQQSRHRNKHHLIHDSSYFLFIFLRRPSPTMMKPPAPSPSQSLLITQPSLASSAHFSSLPRWKTSSSPSLSHVASLSSPLSPSASFKLSQQDKHFHSPSIHSKVQAIDPPSTTYMSQYIFSLLFNSSLFFEI